MLLSKPPSTKMTRLLRYRSSQAFVLITICTAMFTDGFIYGIVVPVIPFVLRDRSLVPEDKVQLWTSVLIAGFGVSDFIGGPISAWYIDRTINRRGPFLGGLFFLGLGTVLFGVANNVWILFFGRVLQGFSSAILYTVGLAVLVGSVKRGQVGQWMGTAMSCNNIGIIVSPLLGGIIYKTSGRRAVFLISMVLLAVDVILRLLMIEGKSLPKAPLQEGQITEKQYGGSDGSSTDLAPGVSTEEQVDHQCPPAAVGCPSNTADTALPEMIQNASAPSPPRPNIPVGRSRRLPGIVRLLRSRRLLAALYGCFINECIVSSLCAILPLFVKQTFNWTSLQAGLMFLTIAIPAFAGPLAGKLADVFGPRWVAVSGFALTTPSLILLRLVDHHSKEQMILLCVLLTLAGTTIILFLSPLGADLSFVAEEESQRSTSTSAAKLTASSISTSVQRPNASTLSVSTSRPPTAAADDNASAYSSNYASSFSLMNSSLAAATIIGPLFAGWLAERYGWGAATTALGGLCISGVVPCFFYTATGYSRPKPPAAEEEKQDGTTSSPLSV